MSRSVGLCFLILTSCAPTGAADPEPDDAPRMLDRRLSGIVQVDAAGNATCALSEHGVVYCWGLLTDGGQEEPAAPFFGIPAHRPVRIDGPRAKRIAVSPHVVTMIDADGSIHAVGKIGDGFGDGFGEWRAFRRTGIDGAKSMFKARDDFGQFAWVTNDERIGYRHAEPWSTPSGVLLDEHSPGCFGTHDSVQCERRVIEFKPCLDASVHTYRLALPSRPLQIHASSGGGCALLESGAIECASTPRVRTDVGCGPQGSGSESTRSQHRFGWAGPFEGMAVDVESETGFGLRPDGTVERLESGERVPGATFIVELTASTGHTCGLRGDREVVCWGENALGQLGSDGTAGARSNRAGPVARPRRFVEELTPTRAARRPSARWTSTGAEMPPGLLCPEIVGETVTRSTARWQ